MNLYELAGSLSWIKNFIYKYNEYGFQTITSQPGNSTFVSKKQYNEGKYIFTTEKSNITRKQRAYIRGYMNNDMATFIINKLLNDNYLFARSQNYNNIPLDEECKLGSVIFIDDKPICNDMEDKDLSIRGQVSFNLSVPLHRPIENLVEFDVIDRRWNNNDYLWATLLNIIKEYKNIC